MEGSEPSASESELPAKDMPQKTDSYGSYSSDSESKIRTGSNFWYTMPSDNKHNPIRMTSSADDKPESMTGGADENPVSMTCGADDNTESEDKPDTVTGVQTNHVENTSTTSEGQGSSQSMEQTSGIFKKSRVLIPSVPVDENLENQPSMRKVPPTEAPKPKLVKRIGTNDYPSIVNRPTHAPLKSKHVREVQRDEHTMISDMGSNAEHKPKPRLKIDSLKPEIRNFEFKDLIDHIDIEGAYDLMEESMYKYETEILHEQQAPTSSQTSGIGHEYSHNQSYLLQQRPPMSDYARQNYFNQLDYDKENRELHGGRFMKDYPGMFRQNQSYLYRQQYVPQFYSYAGTQPTYSNDSYRHQQQETHIHGGQNDTKINRRVNQPTPPKQKADKRVEDTSPKTVEHKTHATHESAREEKQKHNSKRQRISDALTQLPYPKCEEQITHRTDNYGNKPSAVKKYESSLVVSHTRPVKKTEIDKGKGIHEKISEVEQQQQEYYIYFTGISPSTKNENLTYFVEAVTKGECDTEKVIFNHQGTCALVTLVMNHKPDMSKVQERAHKRGIERQKPEVYLMPFPDSIAVSWEGKTSSTESLRHYFESEKRCGGGYVKQKPYETEDGSCFVIQFEDTRVVKRVCERSHTFEGKELRVSPYYTCKAGAIWDSKLHGVKIPGLVLVHLGTHLLQLLQRDCCQALLQRLEGMYCDTTFTDDGLQVKCTLTPKMPKFRSLLRKWENASKSEIDAFIEENISEEQRFQSSQEAWEKLMTQVKSEKILEKGDIVATIDTSSYVVMYVGLKSSVREIDAKLHEFHNQIQRQLRKTSKTENVQDNLAFGSEEYEDTAEVVCKNTTSELCVYGMKNEAPGLKRKIIKIVEENAINKDSVKCGSVYIKFIKMHRTDLTSEVEQKLEHHKVKIALNDDTMVISGTKAGIAEAKTNMIKFFDSMVWETYAFPNMAVIDVIKDVQTECSIHAFEKETRCLIVLPGESATIMASGAMNLDRSDDSEDGYDTIGSASASAKHSPAKKYYQKEYNYLMGNNEDVMSKDDKTKYVDQVSSVNIHIHSDCKENIARCKQELDSKLGQVYTKQKIDDYKDVIKSLTTEEMKFLEFDGYVDIKTDTNTGIIAISGQLKRVSIVKHYLKTKLLKMKRQQHEISSAGDLYKVVQWHYEEDTQTECVLKPYEKTLNHQIEKAYQENKSDFEFDDDDGDTYVIDFQSLFEYRKSDKKKRFRVLRRDILKAAAGLAIPDEWTEMKDKENIKVVPLKSTDTEYTDIEQRFTTEVKTGAYGHRLNFNPQNMQVDKIERIQNRALFHQYQAKKKQMADQKPNLPANLPIERELWHAIKQDAITSIQMHGFNRSYSGNANGKVVQGKKKMRSSSF